LRDFAAHSEAEAFGKPNMLQRRRSGNPNAP
jgi:hypothetical protein